MGADERIFATRSVCPVCLKEIGADITARDDGIYMDKTCPEHGAFRTLVWADNRENYLRWLRFGGVDTEALPQTMAAAEQAFGTGGFGCAACQGAASAALMTTNRCNMDCPVCFTRDKKEPLYEPDLGTCERLMRQYRAQAGEDALIELCGGEPTVRKDILPLAALAREIGFDYIQLNTNGIRLARDAEFCRALRESGVTTVYMGFDGMTDRPYLAKYGKPMLDIKKRAVENCGAAGLAVVLVTCVIPGENDGELGQIVDFAKNHMPAVRGVYLQPISYFGIYPRDDIRRITIPDVIRKLAAQHPELSVEDFCPGAYDHPQCSFNACYAMDKNGALRPLTRLCERGADANAVHRVRANMRMAWLPNKSKLLTIGGMAFQDAWNIDLMRVQKCSIQIIQKDGRLLPLCSKYLSSCTGGRLFPGIG